MVTQLSRRAVLAAALSLPAARLWGQDAGLAQRPPTRPIPDAAELVAASRLRGTVGYALLDNRGTLLDGALASEPLPPASTMKVLTALYALARLGPDHRFRTRVVRAGDMLVLVGGGDPILSSDDLESLAADLVASGQTSPARFAVWGGALPRLTEIVPDQPDHLAYNPAVSGMILNFNRVHLGWRHVGGGLQMRLEARAAANRHAPIPSPPSPSISATCSPIARMIVSNTGPWRGPPWLGPEAAGCRFGGPNYMPATCSRRCAAPRGWCCHRPK